MNIIRTPIVELSTIPAVAYKQKLASGGAGLKILRLDQDVAAVFTLDRRGGTPLPYGKADPALFPEEALDEAMELTIGLPYSARGKVRLSGLDIQPETEDVGERHPTAAEMVNSEEYTAIVKRYTDEKGKMNYTLMNKDFIQFASKSKVVADMVAAGAMEEDILASILKSRATFLSGKKESLSDEKVNALIETLDEIDPRSAFKELKSFIRRLMARR